MNHTRRTEKMGYEFEQNRDIDPETQKQIEASIPMKRQGETSEIIDLVLFLLSDQVTYITGAIMTIDGGHSLQLFES